MTEINRKGNTDVRYFVLACTKRNGIIYIVRIATENMEAIIR
jgi:hypothetical protein